MSDSTVNPASTDDPLADPALPKETVTNDAVAGETVIDNGNYAGPTGSEPLEAEPDLPQNELEGEQIDLSDTE